MFAITNKTERLIHAPNGEMLPPGVTVTVSEDTMSHPQMQTLANEGALEVTEVQDPPDTVSSAGSVAGSTTNKPSTVSSTTSKAT